MVVESLAFINASLQGAYSLLHATHLYIKWQAPLDIRDLDDKKVFKVSSEAMRVTIRMTQIIGWLMLQKAVLTEELSREELLSDHYCVLRGHACLESASETDMDLPPRLRELLKESRNLYLRILRLDKASRKQPLPSRDIRSEPLTFYKKAK